MVTADDNDEQTWLEWKSTADLRNKHDQVELICRHILALANRQPEDAAKHVGGCGILILGLEPGTIHGLDPVDNADLDKWLSAYLGTQGGPGWTPHWDKIDGQTVLIIEVEAPKQGDPIFTLEKAYGPRSEGTIFVRRRARSEIANADEVRALSRRLLPSAPSRQLSISLRMSDEHFPRPVLVGADAVDSFCDRIEHRLLDALPKEAPPASPFGASTWMDDLARQKTSMSALFGALDTPEDRTEAAYRIEVATYLSAVREAWPDYIEQLATSRPPNVFQVENLTDKNVKGLELSLHVEGDVRIARSTGPEDKRDVRLRTLPRPPRIWGPKKPDPYLGAPSLHIPNYHIPDFSPRARFENGGSFSISFVPQDLRPYETATLDAEHVLLFGPGVKALHGSWQATSTNFDGVATGDFELSVDVDPYVLE